MSNPIYTKTFKPNVFGTEVAIMLFAPDRGKMHGMGIKYKGKEYDFIAHFKVSPHRTTSPWHIFESFIMPSDGSKVSFEEVEAVLGQLRNIWDHQDILRDKLVARIAIQWCMPNMTSGFLLAHDDFLVEQAKKLAKEKKFSYDPKDYGLSSDDVIHETLKKRGR